MMRLSLKRYSFILVLQMFFLISDLVFNCIGVFLKNRESITFIYFMQDCFLIISLALLIYACYSTYVYQAGLTKIITAQFRIPVLVALIYLSLSVSLHTFCVYFDAYHEDFWPKPVTTLFMIQKIWCSTYFYFFKRSILIISDPRFYENFEWINEKLRQKQDSTHSCISR